MIEKLKDIPAWAILTVLFLFLMVCYYVRPDALTEDSAKGVLGALLMSIQHPPKNGDKVEVTNTPANPVHVEEAPPSEKA